MGVFDKIKNALFEVEYVEVEEPPKKEKKVKVHEPKDNKPIAKKIVLPGKREEKIEELEEEELKDEDFEIRPKDETIKEPTKDTFKFMDDEDFEMDYVPEEPSILQIVEEEKVEVEEKPIKEETVEEVHEENHKEEFRDDYHEKIHNRGRESRPYGMDSSYNVPVHEYGTYEKYEEKTYFKPSPIISPIYGILDKNYKKEDVKEKKEIRLSSYSRGNVSVDDIRNKAYGSKREEIKEEPETRFDVEDEEDNVMVDLSDRAKPEVKELTMGDALEYFQDLGLEYNVDYVDVSTDRKNVKPKEDKVEKKDDVKKEEVIQPLPEITEQIEEPIVEVKEEKKVDVDSIDDNDNLFDLIDSMYQENN